MATPELVIADAPIKSYPGNVIAVRCADWLAGARGTLSTESDSDASSGQAVRDTQQVTGILADKVAAYGAADDTLTISDLPFIADRYYHVWATIRIEGYLDVTDGAVLRSGYNENWGYATVFGLHGAGLATYTSESNPRHIWHCPPPLPYYRAVRLAAFTNFRVLDPSEPITLRMASEGGTTIEWLLDQLVFLPYVPNAIYFSGTASLGTAVAVEDGADSGDDNGKFTWFPRVPDDGFSSTGDNQRKADGDDAEYFARITAADSYGVFDGSEGESPSFLYSLHTANYRGERTWTDDTYDNRDTFDPFDTIDMGISPEGYGYEIDSSGGAPDNYAVATGGDGFLEINELSGSVKPGMGGPGVGSTGPNDQGLRFQLYDQYDWSVVWEHTAGVPAGAAFVRFWPGYAGILESVSFDLLSGVWWLTDGTGVDQPSHDISGWFGVGALVGFRLEVKRYLMRIRVWDTSGAEPSTWDEEFFRVLATPSTDTYPYGDDETETSWVKRSSLSLHMDFQLSVDDFDQPYDILIHDWKVAHDPYGDSADMVARIERPEGTTAGEITVPFGSSHFVYWGKRDWTEYDSGSDVYASEFSVKVWNDPAAAEIQRAECDHLLNYWIAGGIVSMNWSSAQPADITRVHA